MRQMNAREAFRAIGESFEKYSERKKPIQFNINNPFRWVDSCGICTVISTFEGDNLINSKTFKEMKSIMREFRRDNKFRGMDYWFGNKNDPCKEEAGDRALFCYMIAESL